MWIQTGVTVRKPLSWSWVRWKSQYGSNVVSTHILFVPCQSAIPFLRWDFFKIWPWKSKVKVEVKVEGHKVDVTSYRFTTLLYMSIDPSIAEIIFFLNLTLKIQGQGQMTMMLHNYRSRQFHRTSNSKNQSSGLTDKATTNLAQVLPHWTRFGPWASPYGANGQITMTMHKYRSRQVHKTLHRLNPSSSFRDLCSASLDPICAKSDKFLVHGQAHMGQMTMTVHNYMPRQFNRTWNGENPSSGYRDMGSASLAATRLYRDDNTPPTPGNHAHLHRSHTQIVHRLISQYHSQWHQHSP